MLIYGLDPRDLAAAGWGVIFPDGYDVRIRSALNPLLELRRRQIGNPSLYREYFAAEVHKPGESAHAFLRRRGAGPGPVDPAYIPYYLLLVGGPGEIAYEFQRRLGVQHAVGRLHFGEPQDYRTYAESVVRAEQETFGRRREAVLVNGYNDGGNSMPQSQVEFVEHIARSLMKCNGWRVRLVAGKEADPDQLSQLLGGNETPPLLLTVSHNMINAQNLHEHQRFQTSEASLQGTIWFYVNNLSPQDEISLESFVPALSKRLFSSPEAHGALAVVWHGSSFSDSDDKWQERIFESVLVRLLQSSRLGDAMQYVSQRFAELSAHFFPKEKASADVHLDEIARARMSRALSDVRNFIVLGDPAVCLPPAKPESLEPRQLRDKQHSRLDGGHLRILFQGLEAWNEWRVENQDVRGELTDADLTEADLKRVDFVGVNLAGALLRGAVLSYADLGGANLENVNLRDADLEGANLRCASLMGADVRSANLKGVKLQSADLEGANLGDASLEGASLEGANCSGISLVGANLQGTNLKEANLQRAELKSASLRGANLESADLQGAVCLNADLRNANLQKAQFQGAELWGTVLGAVDLRDVHGLDSIHHKGPSIIDNAALRMSKGRLPDAFLRGCGFQDWEIEAAKLHEPNLPSEQVIDITYEISRLKAESPILINPLFISYSHADTLFLETLEKRLNEKHIRYWRDVHDLKAGRLERQIERAIRHNPTVLLILSKRSVDSDWVEWEASKARQLEKDLARDVLCPITLDDAWKTCDWPGPLRRQMEDYYVLDFSKWHDPHTMARQFARLVEGLGINYPKAAESSHG